MVIFSMRNMIMKVAADIMSLIGIEGPKWLVDPAWAILAVIIASAFGVCVLCRIHQ